MTEGMVFFSTLVTNIAATKIEEEGTEVASSSNLKCSIVGVVGMKSNRVGIVVENSSILVDL